MTRPTSAHRLSACQHGVPSPVMYQRWADLLFLHWRWNADDLQKRLPPGLFVDTFDGDAWLGVVPFFMERIRPRFLPPVPWLSWFLELNVRTYVHDASGTPGVWFFSLDCNQPLAVRIARSGFHLPYHDAKMSAQRRLNGGVRYECRRRGQAVDAVFDYHLGGEAPRPQPDSLEFFLVERYVLFAQTRRGLRLGRVAHSPYPLADVLLAESQPDPLIWNGFAHPGRTPDHIAGSKGVNVRVGALTKF